jgi:hypothetical protein
MSRSKGQPHVWRTEGRGQPDPRSESMDRLPDVTSEGHRIRHEPSLASLALNVTRCGQALTMPARLQVGVIGYATESGYLGRTEDLPRGLPPRVGLQPSIVGPSIGIKGRLGETRPGSTALPSRTP